jgi:sugar lactone lactonase YvrE
LWHNVAEVLMMPGSSSRYAAPASAWTAAGWTLERVTPPSRLFGANGIRTGADGRIYVAQVSGSQISAVDVTTGAIETVSPLGGDIVAPDDLVFDDEGNLYVTEITENRVTMLTPGGRTRVIHGDMPVANPITLHQGRLIAGECRMGARIMELDRDGGAPRVLLEDVPMANAFSVGPDGMLYFPVMAANEIWRVSLDGGAPERVIGELGVPDAVKFDAKGRIVSTQVGSGQVLRIDPRTGTREVLADLTPGLDNVTFVGDRIFVSNMTGYITEILDGGRTRDLVADGLNWPLGLAMAAPGVLYIADGAFFYRLRLGEAPRIIGHLFSQGYPGYARGVTAVSEDEFIVATATGVVARYWPDRAESEVLADGFEQLYGVAVGPGRSVVVADQGTGRVTSILAGETEVLASGLSAPTGVAIDAEGRCLVSETGAGRVVRLDGGAVETVVDGLVKPQGLLVRDGLLFIVDAGAKELIAFDLATGRRSVVAGALPVGAPAGVTPKFIGPMGAFCGPIGPFADVTSGPDGVLYVSGDAEGSVLAVRPGGEKA